MLPVISRYLRQLDPQQNCFINNVDKIAHNLTIPYYLLYIYSSSKYNNAALDKLHISFELSHC